jgi:membrane protein DedA with SNARE-associated domain
MVRGIGAQIGLLAFAVAVLAGLYSGNSVTVTLTRALVAMVIGSLVGQIAGWAAKLVLRDHLQRKKIEIDREHLAAIREMTGEPETTGSPAADGAGDSGG